MGDGKENNQVEEAPAPNFEEGGEEGVRIISSPPRERVKSPTLETLFQNPPFAKSTLESASKHYGQFKTKISWRSTGTPLNCRDHQSFEDIREL